MTMEDFILKAVELEVVGVDMTVYWLKSRESAYLHNLRHLAFKHGIPFSGAAYGTEMCEPDAGKRAAPCKVSAPLPMMSVSYAETLAFASTPPPWTPMPPSNFTVSPLGSKTATFPVTCGVAGRGRTSMAKESFWASPLLNLTLASDRVWLG